MSPQFFTDIVNKYANRLYGYIIKIGVPAQEANDIMQNTYEALWKSKMNTEEECGKYLFGVAYNQCANYWRSKKIVYDITKLEITSNANENNLLKQTMHNMLAMLNEQQRSLIMLKDYEGYSYKEIEEITGLQEAQVKVYLHRARQVLQNKIVDIKNII